MSSREAILSSLFAMKDYFNSDGRAMLDQLEREVKAERISSAMGADEDQKLNISVCEWVGWKRSAIAMPSWAGWCAPDEDPKLCAMPASNLPNYLTGSESHRLIYEAEELLRNRSLKLYWEYADIHLPEVVMRDNNANRRTYDSVSARCASPRQRAEALMRTVLVNLTK